MRFAKLRVPNWRISVRDKLTFVKRENIQRLASLNSWISSREAFNSFSKNNNNVMLLGR